MNWRTSFLAMPRWILLGIAPSILGTGMALAIGTSSAGSAIPFAVATAPFAIRWVVLMLQPPKHRVPVHPYRTPAPDESGNEMAVMTTDAVGQTPGMTLFIYCWSMFAFMGVLTLVKHC
jgi:hypothetical protein